MTDKIDELIKEVQAYMEFHRRDYKGSDLDTAYLLKTIKSELLKAKKYREALEKIASTEKMTWVEKERVGYNWNIAKQTLKD